MLKYKKLFKGKKMKKEKLEEKYNFMKNKNNFQTILNNINNFGKSSLNLGQILLLILIIGSTLNYVKIYVLDLRYQVDLTFEQLLAFGFSNLSWFMFLIFMLYISTEFVWQIKNAKKIVSHENIMVIYTL